MSRHELRPAALATALALACMPMPLPATSATTLFKCVEGGRTVYQQQACPVSSQPEPAASAPHAVAAGASVAASAPAAAHKVKPASRPASSAPAKPR